MMTPKLYGELASWWHVMSAPEDYAEEAQLFRQALGQAIDGPFRTLLELGSGGGNTASHLKSELELTLVEPADGMRSLSETLNPSCEHLPGDMRTLRLERSFDGVLIHDAIAYMLTEGDLVAAIETAYEHCRPGGAALLVPDHTRETWRPETSSGGHDVEGRSMRYLSWSFDPDPSDTTFTTTYAYLLREGSGAARCVEDVHVEGVFPKATWLDRMAQAGFDAAALPFEHSSFEEGHERVVFVGRRPSSS